MLSLLRSYRATSKGCNVTNTSQSEKKTSEKKVQHWAIVGGGMMGLTIARLLAQAGQRVTILEARPNLGGLADAWQLGDIVWDRHYHVTLLSDSRLRALIDDLGLSDEVRWIETKTGFYSGGKFYSMSGALEFLKFPPLTLIEKLRLGGTIFFGSKIKDWKSLESIPVATWLRKWSGNGTFEKIWLPLLRAKLGEAYQRTSAAFIWSYIARMYKARRTGLKKEMFGYVRGGYAKLLGALHASLEEDGVETRLSQQIKNIASNDGSNDGSPTITFEDGSQEHFDRVVVTTATNVVSKLCPDLTAEEHQRFQDIEYLGIVCASVLLDRPFAGYYVTNITDKVPFTAVIEMTTLVDPKELGGHTLVYLPKYTTPDDPIVSQSDEEVRYNFMVALKAMYPDLTDENVQAFRISRVRNVMAIPTLNYSSQLPPVTTSLESVFAINSAHILDGTLNVNETITLGETLFEQHLQALCNPAKEATTVK